MSHMFAYAAEFNGDISKWDVSSVTDMKNMFNAAISFNGDISKWDVSSVTDMGYILHQTTSFTRTLCGAWKDSDATGKAGMFLYSGGGQLCSGALFA